MTAHTRTHACSVRGGAQAQAQGQARDWTHSLQHSHARTRTRAHVRKSAVRSAAILRQQADQSGLKPKHTRTRAHTHARTHANTNTHTHTHTHTAAPAPAAAAARDGRSAVWVGLSWHAAVRAQTPRWRWRWRCLRRKHQDDRLDRAHVHRRGHLRPQWPVRHKPRLPGSPRTGHASTRRDGSAAKRRTSAPGLGSPLPHLRRDWARPYHICAGTGLAPHWAHPSHICAGTCLRLVERRIALDGELVQPLVERRVEEVGDEPLAVVAGCLHCWRQELASGTAGVRHSWHPQLALRCRACMALA